MSFDKDTRNLLAKTVTACRRRLIEDITDQLQGVFGLHPDGTVLPLEKLTYLSLEQNAAARHLRDLLDHYIIGAAGKESDRRKAAYERMVLEISFTVLNRLAALRLCEERGLVIECVRKGTASAGFQMFERISTGALGARYDTYRVFLECMFDELALDLGVLFDRMTPQSAVFPTERCLDEVLAELNKPDLTLLWSEDETIGWIYQYFNPPEERKAMRDASQAPQNNRELAVRNQFFTPRYVVEFLTDNTLGQIWYEMRKGYTVLKEECRYFVWWPNEVFLSPERKAPDIQESKSGLSQDDMLKLPVYIEHRPKKDPRDLRVIDPACGSGHFLLYAYDLLEKIYEEAWDDPESPKYGDTSHSLKEDFKTLDDLRLEAPKLILEHNLYGIDIDPRAVQIAALALWLRAQKTWKKIGIKANERPRITKSNIVTAEPMPGEEDMLREFTTSLSPRVLGQIVEEVFDKMKLAGEAGSLLKIEDEIKDAVAAAVKQWREGPKPEQQLLFPTIDSHQPRQQKLRFDVKGITDDRFWEKAEDHILCALEEYAERAENGRTVRRRLFAEDAARGFAFIDLCRKRYDIVLMNPPFGDASHGSRSYLSKTYPCAKHDLAAAFVDRADSLIGVRGDIGCISTRTLFFLPTSAKWRKKIFSEGHIGVFADLGLEVMDAATVYAAAYTFMKERAGDSIFFRGTDWQKKEDQLYEEKEGVCKGTIGTATYLRNIIAYSHLPGWVTPYYLPPKLSEVFSQYEAFGKVHPGAKQGIATSDDFRFVRTKWEVPGNFYENGWVFHTKGGEFSPYYVDVDFLLNWASNGNEVKAFAEKLTAERFGAPSWSRWINSVEYYFRTGLTFTYRSRRFGASVMPPGVIFGVTGMGVFIDGDDDDRLEAMAVLNSSPFNFLLFMLCERRDPLFQAGKINAVPWPSKDFSGELIKLAAAGYHDSVHSHSVEENCPFYRGPLFSINTNKSTINDLVVNEKEWIAELLYKWADRQNKIDQIVSQLYGIDELAFTALRGELAVFLGDKDHDSFGSPTARTKDELLKSIISFIIGCCFGRWDILYAVGKKPAPELPVAFSKLPVWPPIMLQGPDGPANKAEDIPCDYPLSVSWDGILVDDPGLNENQPHREDIVSRVREVIDFIWKDKAHEIEQEACEILGVSDLRVYFRKPTGFFQDHLKRYSKSRRKAPIYWPLSTPSGSYTIWLYSHRLTDQTLYAAVNKYVGPKINEVERGVAGMEDDLKSVFGRDATRLTDRLSEARSFLCELRDLRDELLRITALPFKPDLNDGVIITAAPFHNLFRLRTWFNDTEGCWKKLSKGDFDWAHLAYAIWPDRVREVCRTDRSIAIAHGLEDLCEVKAPGAKKKGGSGRRKRRSAP